VTLGLHGQVVESSPKKFVKAKIKKNTGPSPYGRLPPRRNTPPPRIRVPKSMIMTISYQDMMRIRNAEKIIMLEEMLQRETTIDVSMKEEIETKPKFLDDCLNDTERFLRWQRFHHEEQRYTPKNHDEIE